MIRFPKNLYADVRIEDSFETVIQFQDNVLQEQRVRETRGAFVRVFDGLRWYTAATSDSSEKNLQNTVDDLAALATPNANVLSHPTVKALHAHQSRQLRFTQNCVRNVSEFEKKSLLQQHFSVFKEFPHVSTWRALFRDKYVGKQFFSSKGSNLEFDTQIAGMVFGASLLAGERQFSDNERIVESSFSELKPSQELLRTFLHSCDNFVQNSVPLEPGLHTVLLSPNVAGVFAHESFGHKSEADFMLGDPAMLEEWKLGKRVAAPILSIIDSGCDGGSGDLPFDDEGNATERTYLIKDGILMGRLHTAHTAGALGEEPTGNARALDFEFEPMPRMRSTFIVPGQRPLAEILASISEGIFVESLKHGFGMSTFTIAPARAWRIRDGRIAEPVQASVLSGNVMSTLNDVEAVSSEFKLLSDVRGGCGKMDQYPLPVGLGGPYVLVRNMRIS